MLKDVFEGVVTTDFNEGLIPDISLGSDERYDSLHERLYKFEGKRVRVTIEEIGRVKEDGR